MLLEVQRRGERAIIEQLAHADGPGRSLRALLERIIEAIVSAQAATARPDLQREILAIYVRQPQPIFVEPMNEPIVLSVGRAFDDAAERGELRTDIPVEELVGIFLNSLFGWVLSSADSLENKRAEIDRFLEVYLRGIAP